MEVANNAVSLFLNTMHFLVKTNHFCQWHGTLLSLKSAPNSFHMQYFTTSCNNLIKFVAFWQIPYCYFRWHSAFVTLMWSCTPQMPLIIIIIKYISNYCHKSLNKMLSSSEEIPVLSSGVLLVTPCTFQIMI